MSQVVIAVLLAAPLGEPVVPKEEYILFVTLNECGELIIHHDTVDKRGTSSIVDEVIKDPKAVERRLSDEMKKLKAKAGDQPVLAIIRAPVDARFGDVMRMNDTCRKAGADAVQMRLRISTQPK